MKKWFWKNAFLAVLFALPAGFFAQNPVADSLARLLEKAKQDTHRVNLLIDLAWEINETHTDEAANKLNEAIALAQRLKFPKGEATAWNGLGVVEEFRSDYAQAEICYRKALDIRRRLGDKRDIGSSYNNLGVLYEYVGRFDSALVFHNRNLDIQKTLQDTAKIARAFVNIAGVYIETGSYPEAQSQILDALFYLERLNDQDGIAKAFTQLGHIQLELDRYAEALPWYEKALKLREQLNDEGRLAEALTDYANALDELKNKDSSSAAIPYYMRALDIWKKMDNQSGIAQVYTNLADAHKKLGNHQTSLDYLREAEKICLESGNTQALMEVYNVFGDTYGRMKQFDKALKYTQTYHDIARESGDLKYLQRAFKDFSEVYSGMGDFATAYKWRVRYDSLRYTLLNEKLTGDYARKEAFFTDRKKQEQIEKQEQALRVQEAEIATARIRQYALLGGAVALMLLAGLLFNRNRIRARANRELAAKNAAIQRERERADGLLKNILPEKTAEELKLHNAVQPVRYESVTVMFTDFKGFTKIAEQVSPESLIALLDDCFRLFDAIVVKYGLEKIKTIGDAYMCAGGLPTPNDTHPVDTVKAALEMLHGLNTLMQKNAAAGKPVFEMRVGIHTGPVVAGVVGSHKFAYDIWGDTVNTAARLEQNSEPGKINISETTHQQVKHLFDCTFRGKLAAKNKGEIAMYFVNG